VAPTFLLAPAALLRAVIYPPGSALCFPARREQKETVCTSTERLVFGLIVVAALAGVDGFGMDSIAV